MWRLWVQVLVELAVDVGWWLGLGVLEKESRTTGCCSMEGHGGGGGTERKAST